MKMRLRSKSDSTHDRSKFKFRRTRRKRSDGDLAEEVFKENGDVVSKVRNWAMIQSKFDYVYLINKKTFQSKVNVNCLKDREILVFTLWTRPFQFRPSSDHNWKFSQQADLIFNID